MKSNGELWQALIEWGEGLGSVDICGDIDEGLLEIYVEYGPDGPQKFKKGRRISSREREPRWELAAIAWAGDNTPPDITLFYPCLALKIFLDQFSFPSKPKRQLVVGKGVLK